MLGLIYVVDLYWVRKCAGCVNCCKVTSPCEGAGCRLPHQGVATLIVSHGIYSSSLVSAGIPQPIFLLFQYCLCHFSLGRKCSSAH